MEDALQRYDRPRYVCALFLRPPQRAAVQAVLAWNLEIAQIAERVSEPMLGHIRFSWWRETLAEMQAGKPAPAHPVAQGLVPWMPVLSFACLETMMEARQALLDGPVVDPHTHARATGGALNLLCADVLGVTDAALREYADRVGTAYACAGTRQPLSKDALERLSPPGIAGARRHEVIFFRKQAVIARHWATHPDDAERATLPWALMCKLLF